MLLLKFVVVEVDVYGDRESVGESYWEWEGYVEWDGDGDGDVGCDGYVEWLAGGLVVGDWEWDGDGDGDGEWLTIVYLDWNLR